MRSFIVVVALVAAVAQVSAAHVPHVPHRGRRVEVMRELGDSSSNINLVARAPASGLRRSRRCPAKSPTSGLTSTEAPPASPTSTRTTQNGGSGPTKTQGGAAPTATRTSAVDPWLKSLSEPLNYAAHSFFTEPKHGDVTFYAQGQTACGDVYSDRTLTAAISQLSYDAWPGADYATNRNPGCGPFVSGRYFLSPSNETVPGSAHAVIGGDGFINCALGEQCHRPLTATITNPRNGAKVTVWVVDRCQGCAPKDIDLSPAAFLRLTRPDFDLSKVETSQLMIEALKDHDGRIPMDWKYDSNQQFRAVQSV